MKLFTLLFAFMLSIPVMANTQQKEEDFDTSSTVNEAQLEEEKADFKDNTDVDEIIQKEEDFEATTPAGNEIEYDKDVLGDDEIEIND